MRKVKIGIIGVGVMGRTHAGYMNEVDGAELAAVCDTDPAVLDQIASLHGVPGYSSHEELLGAGLCDAIIIATPHWSHPPIAIDAFAAAAHVLCEKPIGVTTQAVREALAAHANSDGLVFAGVFQQRTMNCWRAVKSALDSGRLGELRRVTWIMTGWFRTQAYYDSGGWRATWGGEGGGVLMNQAPHTLDLLTWLVGMPSRVTAQCTIARAHDIEVEDEVNALLEYPNGATGHFFTTTGEAPESSRLEIVGDRGRIVIDGFRATISEAAESVRDYCRNSPNLYGTPKFETRPLESEPETTSGHKIITQNFVNAIRSGEPLIAPAAEGLNSLSLANAMLLSGLKRRPVEIPFDDAEYADMIRDLVARSTFRKGARQSHPGDLSPSVHYY